MANIKGTQVKDLPLSDNIIGTDVLIKQNINTRQTQRFTAQTLLDHTRQELDIDTIEDNIEDLQIRTTNIEKKGLFGVWSADATYGLYAIVRKNNTYWISLQDNNTNHDPEELNSEWWEKFQLENFPHIIYSNYTVKPYYEVFSNGMCRQWSMADPSDTSSAYTTNTTFSFAIPYKNTGYLLYPVGFDVSYVGEQRVTPATTGFTTSSLGAASGTRVWVAYGEVDLEQISDYIL